MKVSRTRWKHRSTSARNSAFLVGKRRNRYGWLMPACRATSSVEVPASPCAANSATAASRTSSRRSAAGIRCLVSVIATKVVMTHYYVKAALERGEEISPAPPRRTRWSPSTRSHAAPAELGTVSQEPSVNADLRRGQAEIDAALETGTPFSPVCQVYAP